MSNTKAAHYRGTYHVRSRALVAAARNNPDTRCRRCGLTRTEAILHGLTPRQADWTAGHIVDGEVDGALAPEHHHCNASAGATHGNQRRNRNHRNWWND